MRILEEQRIALECLRLVSGEPNSGFSSSDQIVDRASAFFAFVTGNDLDDARAKLDAVREVVT